jgi:hypothetical protein
MKKVWFRSPLAFVCAAVLATGCAVRPIPDPRAPAAVQGAPVLLRVCFVDGDGAHLAVGDQVELSTGGLGNGLRIRHIPATGNQNPVWNDGREVKVRAAVLVEMVAPRGDSKNTRRFVPVGRFPVSLGDEGRHGKFDFLTSKATENLTNNRFPECNVELGDDEVIVRGVKDDERHGGDAHLR